MKKNWWLATIGIALYVSVIGATTYSTQAQKATENPATSVIQETVVPLNADKIYALVNQQRIKGGLAPLSIDAEISAVSQFKADDMVNRNYFSHFDPVTGKNTIWANSIWEKKCTHASENISKN